MNKQLLFVIVIYNLDFHQSSTYQTLLLPHSDIPTYIIDNSLYKGEETMRVKVWSV